MAKLDNGRMDEQEINRRVADGIEIQSNEKRKKFEKHFGTFGKYILECGVGGGFTAIPHAIDMYERALGLSIEETWLMKRLCRYLPNIHPTMKRIYEKEANIGKTKLSNIKRRLIEKGFIRDLGRVSKDNSAHKLDIMPFFDAVFLCLLCDPSSKIVVDAELEKVRIDFTEDWLEDREEAEWRKENADFFRIDLPLSIEAARKFAEMRHIQLDWQTIRELQNEKAQELLEEKRVDKERMLRFKDAIKNGIDGEFGIVYNYGKTYEWLKWLVNTRIRLDEVEKLTDGYVRQAESPNAKEYMEWMRQFLESPRSAKILAEREVEYACLD